MNLLKPLDKFINILGYIALIRSEFKTARPNGEQIIDELDQKFMISYRKQNANKK